jgi:hypothetical protein
VRAYLNGVLVKQATGQPAAALASFSNPSSGFIFSFGCTNWTPYVDFSIPVAMSVAGTNVTCDHLFITPENVTLGDAPTAMNITASQVPSITMIEATVSPWLVSFSLNNQTATLQWYGTGVLQESTNLTIWTDIINASSPYAAAAPPNQPGKFYRLIFSP